ncbi:MAG: lipopolysaccharide biosynthesis protein [Acidobacteria bacterium]|nr:lipopolysaccharide biosynthesis protein [Acidobacteriota bacterium]
MIPVKEENEKNAADQAYTIWAGRTIRGVAWTYAAVAGSRVAAFASLIVLARILTPSAFGQLGFALLVITYLDALGDLGAGSALIFYRKKSEEAAQTSFRINLITGALWWCAVTALAPFAGGFFHDEMVEPLLRALAWIFPITALGNTHDALLRSNLSFGRRLVPDYARSFTKAICAVALAWQGWGVWSLVWGQLAGAAIWTLALWALMEWRPKFRAPMSLARRMLRYGCHIASINVLSTIVHHFDLLIVGRILGSAALGFYTLASRIPDVCITMLIWAVDIVAFPSFTKFQDDLVALRRAFRATLRYVSIVTLPAGLGIALTADLAVSLLYGERWLPAAPVVVGLSFAAVLRSLGSHAGNIFKATGRPDILTKIGIARAVLLVPTLIWSTRWGIPGVAAVQAAVTAASTLATLIIAGRILAIPRRAWWQELRPAVVGSVGMVLAALAVRLLAANWPPAAILFLTACAGAAGYAAVLYFNSPAIFCRIRSGIVSLVGRRAGGLTNAIE